MMFLYHVREQSGGVSVRFLGGDGFNGAVEFGTILIIGNNLYSRFTTTNSLPKLFWSTRHLTWSLEGFIHPTTGIRIKNTARIRLCMDISSPLWTDETLEMCE